MCIRDRAKGEPIQRDKSECLVDLRVDAFIPEKYIADGPGRIEAYKRIAAIQTQRCIRDSGKDLKRIFEF